MTQNDLKGKLLAEGIGTYFLVFAGTGAIMVDELTHRITHVGVAITFGLAVAGLIYAFGHISGAHFNPAVTIAFAVRGEMAAKQVLLYIAAQLLGAMAASGTLLALFGNVAHLGATLPRSPWIQAFVLEFLLTFLLMMVILGSAVDARAVKGFAGLAIGGCVGLEAMFAGPICGASMNPARSIAPALLSGATQYVWVYIVAAIGGAMAAAWVSRRMMI